MIIEVRCTCDINEMHLASAHATAGFLVNRLHKSHRSKTIRSITHLHGM